MQGMKFNSAICGGYRGDVLKGLREQKLAQDQDIRQKAD